jgi:hypothetical protein
MTHSSPALSRRALLRAITASGALAASVLVVGCSSDERPRGGNHARNPAPFNPIAPSAAPGTLVMIIRHGEKPDKSGKPPGVDINGNRTDDTSLTKIGWNRARGLADVFDPPGVQPHPGLARPKAIYAAGVTEVGDGERTRETITPLAQRLGIPINTSFGKGDEYTMAAMATAKYPPSPKPLGTSPPPHPASGQTTDSTSSGP